MAAGAKLDKRVVDFVQRPERTKSMSESVSVAGLKIFSDGPNALLKLIVEAAQSGTGLSVHFISANSVWRAESDPAFRKLLLAGGLLVPDSRWVELCSRLSGPPAVQTRGPDVFTQTLAKTQSSVIKHFFIGPNREVNSAVAEAVHQRFPALSTGAFLEAPLAPFSGVDLDSLASSLQSDEATIVWLGIGTPAQDIMAVEICKRTNCVVMAVGAAFEFFAGLKPEAPRIFSRLGLEWLFRLVSEPQRLWRRYLIGSLVFLWAVVKYRLPRRRTTKPV